MRTVALPAGGAMPALGLGTWRMGEKDGKRAAEVDAIKLALDLGYRLIDTAEMYGEGGAEEAIGAALAGHPVAREQVFIVSKVYPHNGSRKGVIAACERSLRRLKTDYIDLYLLHWRGSVPLAETVDAFGALVAQGKIRRFGVSNFDADDMKQLWQLDGGAQCAMNQVYYSASVRGIEFDLVPWQQAHAVPLMAYSPVDQGRLADHPVLAAIGAPHGASAAQVAIAWLLTRAGVIVIPKAVEAAHLRENLAAAALALTAADLQAIDRAFPPPKRKSSLAMT